jgi:hypothetical protein
MKKIIVLLLLFVVIGTANLFAVCNGWVTTGRYCTDKNVYPSCGLLDYMEHTWTKNQKRKCRIGSFYWTEYRTIRNTSCGDC